MLEGESPTLSKNVLQNMKKTTNSSRKLGLYEVELSNSSFPRSKQCHQNQFYEVELSNSSFPRSKQCYQNQ